MHQQWRRYSSISAPFAFTTAHSPDKRFPHQAIKSPKEGNMAKSSKPKHTRGICEMPFQTNKEKNNCLPPFPVYVCLSLQNIMSSQNWLAQIHIAIPVIPYIMFSTNRQPQTSVLLYLTDDFQHHIKPNIKPDIVAIEAGNSTVSFPLIIKFFYSLSLCSA